MLVNLFSQVFIQTRNTYVIITNMKSITYKKTINACSNCLVNIKSDGTITVTTNVYSDDKAHLKISPGICVSLVNKEDMEKTFYECNDYGYVIERTIDPGIYYYEFPTIRSIGWEFEKNYSVWLGYVFVAIILVAFVMYAYTKWR